MRRGSEAGSEAPPEFFAYASDTDIRVDIQSDIHTRPKIPARVTYFTAAPSDKNKAVDHIKSFLIDGSDHRSLFGDFTICGPYLTDALSSNKTFIALEYKPIELHADNDILYEKGFLKEESVCAFAHYLRNSLNRD